MAAIDSICHSSDSVIQEVNRMTSLNISLPEPLREWIETQVKRGRYGNASEYLRDLIRRDQERQAQDRLEDILLEGIKSGPVSYLTKRDWAELRTDVAERLEKRRGGRVKKSR
jgi:antitoxin ParD1/3/4